MHTKDPVELAQLLDSYALPPADDTALLDRIVARAARIPVARPAHLYSQWVKNAALLAATALFGFWCGNMSLQQANMPDAGGGISVDKVIWAPKTLDGVML